jgi:hypothetical protein
MKTKNKIAGVYSAVDPLNIVILGNSHAVNGFNPYLIDEYLGTNSFNYATHGQDLRQTYYFLKELFNRKDINLVVLEIFGSFIPLPEKVNSITSKEYNKYRAFVNEFNFSKIKFEMINSMFTKDLISKMWFPIFNSHQNWRKLGQTNNDLLRFLDFTPDEKGHEKFNINVMRKDTVEDYFAFNGENIVSIREENLKYLEKIIQLVRDNESEILFTFAPIYAGYLEKTNILEENQILNKLCEDNSIKYLNFNEDRSYTTQRLNFKDEEALKTKGLNANQHLNYIGQYNTTIGLIEYMFENKLIDVENQLATIDAEDNSYLVESYLRNMDLEGMILIFASHNKKQKITSEEQNQLMYDLGIDSEMFLAHNTSVYVADYSKDEMSDVSFYTDGEFFKNFSNNKDLKKMDLPMDLSIGNYHNEYIKIWISDVEYSPNAPGTIIIIYDPKTEEIINKAYYNFQFSNIRSYW